MRPTSACFLDIQHMSFHLLLRSLLSTISKECDVRTKDRDLCIILHALLTESKRVDCEAYVLCKLQQHSKYMIFLAQRTMHFVASNCQTTISVAFQKSLAKAMAKINRWCFMQVALWICRILRHIRSERLTKVYESFSKR